VIKVSADIMDILDIDEKSSIFQVKNSKNSFEYISSQFLVLHILYFRKLKYQ